MQPLQICHPPAMSHSKQVPPEVPTAMTRENSQDPDTEPELVSAPMGSLYEVTKLRNLRSHIQKYPESRMTMLEEDFISRGIIPLEEAERLFHLFFNTMNQFLWGGISLVHSDLTSVRRSSSLPLRCYNVGCRSSIVPCCRKGFIRRVLLRVHDSCFKFYSK